MVHLEPYPHVHERSRQFSEGTEPMRSVVAFLLAPAVLGVVPGLQHASADPPALALVLQGRVEDRETHRPITGATVRVRRIVIGSGGRADPSTPAETMLETDAGGRIKAVFPSHQVGDPRLLVTFEVSHPGYAAQSSPLVPLAQLNISRTLGDRPSLGVIGLERGLEYRGRVFAPDGKPAADVPYEFSSGHEGEIAETLYFQPNKVEGRTDRDGRIRFRAASTDVIHLRLTPPNWAPNHALWGSDRREPGYKTWKRENLGEHRLERGVVITGRLRDLKGRPLPGQRLAATGGEGGYVRTAETDAAGRFAFAPLSPGKYLVVGEKQYPSFWGLEDPAPSPSDAMIIPVAIEVHAGLPPRSLELSEAETVPLVIHHVDSRGRPVAGFPVNLVGSLSDPPGELAREDPGPTDLPADVFVPAAEVPRPGQDEPSPDLVWSIQGLAGSDGTAKLRVLRGMAAALNFSNLLIDASFRVKLSPDGPLETDFDPELGLLDGEPREITVVWFRAPTVVARIRFDGGELPNDARVDILRNVIARDNQEEIEKLPDGRFRSRRLLPDHEYLARAVAEGCEGPEVKFTLPEGAIKEMTLELKRLPEPKQDEDP
jgi:hypothetical protein